MRPLNTFVASRELPSGLLVHLVGVAEVRHQMGCLRADFPRGVVGRFIFSPGFPSFLSGWLVLSGLGGFPSALVVPNTVLGQVAAGSPSFGLSSL